MQGIRNEHGLTPKQEAFAQAVITTGILTAAYCIAYPSSRMKRTTAQRRAKELAKVSPVAARIKALMGTAPTVDQSSLPAITSSDGSRITFQGLATLKANMDIKVVTFTADLAAYAEARDKDDKEYRVAREAYIKLRDVLFPKPKLVGVELPAGTKEAALFLKMRGFDTPDSVSLP